MCFRREMSPTSENDCLPCRMRAHRAGWRQFSAKKPLKQVVSLSKTEEKLKFEAYSCNLIKPEKAGMQSDRKMKECEVESD